MIKRGLVDVILVYAPVNLFKVSRTFHYEIFSSSLSMYFKIFPPESEAVGSRTATHLEKNPDCALTTSNT
jgi:hypothetical protein